MGRMTRCTCAIGEDEGPAAGALSSERHFLRTGHVADGEGGGGEGNVPLCLSFSRTEGREDVLRCMADQSLIGDSGERGDLKPGSEDDADFVLGLLLGMDISRRRCQGRRRGVSGGGMGEIGGWNEI
jgi:hypothetical protein